MVKKILSILLVMTFMLGNICFAQTLQTTADSNINLIGAGSEQQYGTRELCYEDRGCRREYRHHHRHRHHDDRAADIIAGIVIYEVVKSALD